MKKNPPSPESLLKLLSDEDDIARVAMVQLLGNYGHETSEILRQLQECDDPVLRKRSHQMQALLTFKKRRLDLFDVIQRRKCKFFLSDILKEMHLTWFEQDSPAELSEMYNSLLRSYPHEKGYSLDALCDFMKEQQFIILPDSSDNAQHYMLGAVLENKFSSYSFMAALFLAICEDLQIDTELQVILFEHRFYIYDRQSSRISNIQALWSIRELNFNDFKIVDGTYLLKFMTAVCFCNAIHEDAFRYIQILGEMLSPSHSTSSLPYPFGGGQSSAE